MQTQSLPKFRVVVRGTNADGRRIRKVFTKAAATEGEAAMMVDEKEALKGIRDPYLTVLPPLH